MKEITIIVLLAVALLAGWAWYNRQLNQANERIEVFEAREQGSADDVADLRAGIAKYQSQVEHLKVAKDRSFIRGYNDASGDTCGAIYHALFVIVSTEDGDPVSIGDCRRFIAPKLTFVPE